MSEPPFGSRAILFTSGWSFERRPGHDKTAVTLPHDAMISETRSAQAGTGNHGAYFPGGMYRYGKDWVVPDDFHAREYRLFFEGVYGDTTVSVNGHTVGGCRSGYREFRVPLGDLQPGDTARIEVAVDNTKTPNSRWYTGSGIYRPVWLESVPGTRIAPDGVRITTASLVPEVRVQVEVHAEGAQGGLRARVRLDGAAPTHADVTDGVAHLTLTVPDARLWSAENPELYDLHTELLDGDRVIDHRTTRVGLRSIELDARRGLRVNGRSVLLRGACVHHDNGILGAATFTDAERRRVRMLKEIGFNAVRSSHNPLSRAFLDACDEIGMYVVDELTDVWFEHKTTHDPADAFEDLWPEDAKSMVAKDRTRPSVIIYSIGNEIAETATARGVDAAARITAHLRDLDPTRPTTLAVNLLLNLMASRGASAFNRKQDEPSARSKPAPSSTLANAVTARLGRIMGLVSRLPAADRASKDAFATVDIAGYNYAFTRYRGDRRRYPERVIVGSESMPGDLPKIWRHVQAVPGVIGDFMWTGWDYLGEAGIGVWSYGSAPGGLNKPYPTVLAGCGALDITGQKGAPALLAQAVWNQLHAPAIAVRPLDESAVRANRTPWRTSDAIPSWSWGDFEGPAHIEVYSSDDEVELILNGRSLGRKRGGARTGFITRYRTTYDPGELVAVGYRRGVETGRSVLRSAGHVTLNLREEAGDTDVHAELVFVWVELADELGTVDSVAEDRITVTVEGPATLAAFGSAAPLTEESFVTGSHHTHRGRALAVIRRTSAPGNVTVLAHGTRHGSARIELITRHSAADVLRQ